MKKIYTVCLAAFIICTCSLKLNASVVVVNVEDFEFTPSIFTISVGDTVLWMWDNSAGAHTTTSAVIPSGALTWDQPINQNTQSFRYIALVPGSYNYSCSFHASQGMAGHFTVNGITSVAQLPAEASITLKVNKNAASDWVVVYSISAPGWLGIYLTDIQGKEVYVSYSPSQNTGEYTQTLDVAGLHKGIYVVTLETQSSRLSQKILVQ